jgi:peroxiredoxin
MKEQTGIVMMTGDPLTLVGNELRVGEKQPDFVALA